MILNHPAPDALPRELPLVGRSRELERLFTAFGSGPGSPPLRILTGESGVGKSRLAFALGSEAERRDWRLVQGRAYPVERGVPYAVLADAFVPLFRELDESKLTVLTRGREADLYKIFPALGSGAPAGHDGMELEELRTRLFWTFHSLLSGLASQTPLMIVLEDLHWADASSLALLHFLVRQLDSDDLRIVATCTTEDRAANPELVELERSLQSLGRMERLELSPLDLPTTEELLLKVFGMSGPPVSDFAERLYGWTRGNPYFLEQTLQSLVQSGRLHRKDGTWLGWESRELELPSTVRDAILLRFEELNSVAREAADILAVTGRPTDVRLLQRVLARDRPEVAEAVEALTTRGIAQEGLLDGDVVVRFHHPMTRETLFRTLSLTRRRLLHQQIAAALEDHYGDRAEAHADEIAYHLMQDGTRDRSERTLRYLGMAGRAALGRHADEEATRYLEAALEVASPSPRPRDIGAPGEALRIRRLLARAQARRGAYDEAETQYGILLDAAAEAGDAGRQADILRHLGLIAYWRSRHEEALEHLGQALELAPENAGPLRALIHLAQGMAFQQLGRPQESRARILEGREVARAVGDPGLLGRMHRALALVNTWIGETDDARENALEALALGREADDPTLVFWGQWALASLEGLVGGPNAIREWLDPARDTAAELGSPVLELFVDELELEYLYFSGDWDGALALGTRAAEMGRALQQTALLVRILTWTSSVLVGRGDFEAADELIREAEALAGVENGIPVRATDVHASVPAIIGRTQYHLAQDHGEQALAVGSGGLAVAESSGYVIWVLHRLLPMVGEAHVRLRDLEGARRVHDRLVEEGERMQHRLSLMWATAAQALITWWSGDIEGAVTLLRDAADRMEEIGIVYDSARVRRQLAGRLAELDRRDEALDELRKVHKVFRELGAEPEYRKARHMFSELEARRPAEAQGSGRDTLSPREYEIALLVADRSSNKEIAGQLDISPRTVTTHLHNIYRRLEMDGSATQKRGRLGDMIREGRIQSPDTGD